MNLNVEKIGCPHKLGMYNREVLYRSHKLIDLFLKV